MLLAPGSPGGAVLTPRWTPLEVEVAEQLELWNAGTRFRVVPAGRGSGKTELALRWLALAAMEHYATADGLYVYAAPTRQQAKKIAWRALKGLIPKWYVVGKPSESELSIRLWNGAEVWVVGMDAPQRIEGVSIDGIILDEYANMKAEAWELHVRPTLGRRGRIPGWAWFIGVPEGRNHYYDLYRFATRPGSRKLGWSGHTWPSSRVMTADELANCKATMDPETFKQEFEASFVEFKGRAYYRYVVGVQDSERLRYDPRLPLIFCFDFNVEPGVCAVIQEQPYVGRRRDVAGSITAVLGEVWIPRHSNTPAVCRRLLADWGRHRGFVYAYGDHTGGRRHTTQDDGLAGDWGQIRAILGSSQGFGNRFRVRVKSMVYERDRLAATNSRLMSEDGTVHMLVDPVGAPHVCEDYEGVVYLKGGSGEVLKEPGSERTHMTDAIGYYLEYRFPVTGPSSSVEVAVARG